MGGALAGIGIPRDSVLQYETAIAADGFLVMAHGATSEMAQAEYALKGLHPSHLELHQGGKTFVPQGQAADRLAGVGA